MKLSTWVPVFNAYVLTTSVSAMQLVSLGDHSHSLADRTVLLEQNHATLQYEQLSSSEMNVLRDFSLQPTVTFSFVIGSKRCFYYCILHFFVNIIIPL
jgi:hypothetical protein